MGMHGPTSGQAHTDPTLHDSRVEGVWTRAVGDGGGLHDGRIQIVVGDTVQAGVAEH